MLYNHEAKDNSHEKEKTHELLRTDMQLGGKATET